MPKKYTILLRKLDNLNKKKITQQAKTHEIQTIRSVFKFFM